MRYQWGYRKSYEKRTKENLSQVVQDPVVKRLYIKNFKS